MKPQAEIDKQWILMLIQNYEQLPPLITSIEASYARLLKSMDVIVRTHKIPSIGTLTQAIKKNQVLLDVDRYIEQLMREAICDDLQLSTDATVHQWSNHTQGPDRAGIPLVVDPIFGASTEPHTQNPWR